MTMFKMQFKYLYQDSLARWTQEHIKQSKLNSIIYVLYYFVHLRINVNMGKAHRHNEQD